jgi:hypothetical protein
MVSSRAGLVAAASLCLTALLAEVSVPVRAQTAPAAAASPVPAGDPCGDSNLLATTDRPTFGTNPCVVKPQEAIVEAGYRNTTTTGAAASHVAAFPENRDRIGLLPHLELVLDMPSELRLGANNTTIVGQSNIGTGLKYEFGYFGNFVHGIAAEVVYPTAAAPFTNGLPSFNESYQIGGGIVKNVGFNLTLGFNSFSTPGVAGARNTSTTAFAPTFILGGLVAPNTKLNVEVANNSSNGPGSGGQYFGNVFLQHQFTKAVLLDVEVEQSLATVNGAHTHYVGAGGAFRL